MKAILIVPAAGTGKRLNAGIAKQLLSINNRPLIAWTLERFKGCNIIEDAIIGTSAEIMPEMRKVLKTCSLDYKTHLVRGGKTRAGTVKRCLKKALDFQWDVVLIHDAARPLVSKRDILKIARAGLKHGVAVPGAPARDTLRSVSKRMYSRGTLDRNEVFSIFTPQVFNRHIAEMLFEKWPDESNLTDDASIAEMHGIEVKVVKGSWWNVKVTYPEDVNFISRILK